VTARPLGCSSTCSSGRLGLHEVVGLGEEVDALERGEALLRVGHPVVVDLGGAGEPLASVVLAPGSEQGIGVGVPQPRDPRGAAARLQLGTRQHHHGGLVLAQVAPGAAGHDEQLGPRVRLEALGSRRGGELEGLLRSAEAALAVGHLGEVLVRARHPREGAQLGQRLGQRPVA
jgi:hypothetical protein